MNRERALRTLGLEKGAQADEINRAYRALIRQAHPDAGGRTEVAARITEAYHWLQRAGPAPTRPTRTPRPESTAPPHSRRARAFAAERADDSLALHLPPGDVFTRLCEAGHELGEVSYVDPDTGMVQVTFTAPTGVVCQLTATVIPGSAPGSGQQDTRVEFTLDPLAGGMAPPITAVVSHLTRLIRKADI